MIKVGVTGQNGFVGYHMYQTLCLFKDEFALVNFDRSYFYDDRKLDAFVVQCDVLIHLAGLNRHADPEVIYNVNIELVDRLLASFTRTGHRPHVIISSSTQEEFDNHYGRSKKESRLRLIKWAIRENAKFTGLLIPNIFGPFGIPFYNSVVATFCHQLSRSELPKIHVDTNLKLLYVGELVEKIINSIRKGVDNHQSVIEHSFEIKVTDLLELLKQYKYIYQDKGEIPKLNNSFEKNLFNTFRCYLDIENTFPKKYSCNPDNRGVFIETARFGISGQSSFSTTLPGITRGNHFHTRKIERFSVIKGKALIQLRKIGTSKIYSFYLDGNTPSYVDMPIWYTHNIKNIGEDELYTVFWIDEPFNQLDPDTYLLEV